VNRARILFLIVLMLIIILRAEDVSIREMAVQTPEMLSGRISARYAELCSRLGIQYQDFAAKGLIGYGFTEPERQKILQSPEKLEISTENAGQQQLITFSHPGVNRPVYYALQDSVLVSPYQLQSRDWQVHTGTYIEYRVSDDKVFKQEQLEILDNYCEYLLELLQVPSARQALLKEQKLIYYRCADKEEIIKLTGYNCRGMGILAEDAVVSLYPCHFHELCHLMINFALQDVPLYTHPFLQEGFAVAIGGRGGKNPHVLLDIAAFICEAGFMSPQELWDDSYFRSNDASFTYPVSGLYNRFLLDEIGIVQYLKLYKAYSNSTGEFIDIKISNLVNDQWQDFLEKTNFTHIITICPEDEFTAFETSGDNEIASSQNFIRFTLKSDTLRFDINENIVLKQSGNYQIETTESEINIRNTLTENLVASYASGLSQESRFQKDKAGRAVFYLQKTDLKILKCGF
jgi:hypothetical protein